MPPTATTDVNSGSTYIVEEPVTVTPSDDTTTTTTVVETVSDDVNTEQPIDTASDVDVNDPVLTTTSESYSGGGGGGGYIGDEPRVTTEMKKNLLEKSFNVAGVGITGKDVLISGILGIAGYIAARKTAQSPTGIIGYVAAGMLAGITLSKLVIKKKQ